MTVGENIKRIRKEKGLTQKQLGSLCHMADSAIRRYELGKAQPKLKTIHKIAGGLGVPVQTLIDKCGPEYNLVPNSTNSNSRHISSGYAWDDWLHSNHIHSMRYGMNGREGTLLKFADTNEFYFLTAEQMKLLPQLSIEQTKLLIKAMSTANMKKDAKV